MFLKDAFLNFVSPLYIYVYMPTVHIISKLYSVSYHTIAHSSYFGFTIIQSVTVLLYVTSSIAYYRQGFIGGGGVGVQGIKFPPPPPPPPPPGPPQDMKNKNNYFEIYTQSLQCFFFFFGFPVIII